MTRYEAQLTCVEESELAPPLGGITEIRSAMNAGRQGYRFQLLDC
jgi:hypothetical protein